MTWASIILTVLRLVEWMVRIGNENKWIKIGEDRAIARSSAEVLRKTEFANETLAEITKLDDAGVDDLLRKLEDK